MYFDLHLHYKTVEWALGGSGMPIGVIDMVVDNGAPGWTGNAPEGVVSMEWGPKADNGSAWWNGDPPFPRANKDEFIKYKYEEDDDSNQDLIPARNWRHFLTDPDTNNDPGWEAAQYTTGFRMSDVLDQLKLKGYTAVCYGPVGQNPDTADEFKIASLRATEVSIDAIQNGRIPLDSYIPDDNRWTAMRWLFEGASASHQIGYGIFMPHPMVCDKSVACPDCP